ncbi:HNH endonuclease [Marinobacter sp. C2H3]|uniref:HNH endonuclease n=1 Tax=Marinobacter sp. C2H3 TaxID=3119003 RepID=UPI00300EE659
MNSIYFYVLKGTTRGSIDKLELESWPASIQEEFLNTVRIEKETDGALHFRALRGETFEKALKRLKGKLRSRNRAKKRAQRLWIESEGIYEHEDIEELFQAQDGRCYYSGADLTWSPRDFSIDHLVPVMDGGTSWPGNLVLCKEAFNTEKGVLSKQKFFRILKARFGSEWYEAHKPFLKEADARRRLIDKRRRRAVQVQIDRMADDLRCSFPGAVIDFKLQEGKPTLQVGYYEIRFPCGFLRQKRRFNSLCHLKKIVAAVSTDRDNKSE